MVFFLFLLLSVLFLIFCHLFFNFLLRLFYCISLFVSCHSSIHPSFHPSIYINWQLSQADSRVFSAILPKSRRAAWTQCVNLANSALFFLFFSKKYGENSGSSYLKFLHRGRIGFFFVASWRNFAQKEKRCSIKVGDPRHCTYLRNLKKKNPIIQGLLSFNFCDQLSHKEDLAKLGYRPYK